MEVNAEIAEGLCEMSLMVCTALVPVLGYDKTALVAKEASATGETIRECTIRLGLLSEDDLDVLLDYREMTKPRA